MERLTFEGNFCDIAKCQEIMCPYGKDCSQKRVWERLKYYEDMEEQGRLVVPVVRVGDTVWTNISVKGDRYRMADRPYLVKVVYIGIGEGNAYFHVEYSNGRVFPFDFNKFGKTVFLTCEEAENALKGGTEE